MQSISVATWNVNSVKSRIAHLRNWLAADKPDIVLLQELKCMEESFPFMEIEELGYNLAVMGEKTYNGVAILSRFPLEDITKGLPGDAADTQSRYIEAVVSLPGTALRVASVYVPNGQETGSDKYAYKLRFYARLRAHAKQLLVYEEPLVIGGDYNVAPYDIDVKNVAAWKNTVLCHADARGALRSMLHDGLYDAFRLANPDEPGYSWWDYRANAFPADDGLRIDHLLLSPQAADRLEGARVVKSLRMLEKPSDHTPVVATLRF